MDIKDWADDLEQEIQEIVERHNGDMGFAAPVIRARIREVTVSRQVLQQIIKDRETGGAMMVKFAGLPLKWEGTPVDLGPPKH